MYAATTIMDIKYVDILTGKKLTPIWVFNVDLIYWSVCSFCRWGRDGEKGGMVILASWGYYFVYWLLISYLDFQ